jgi:4-hydroxy-4-methyl-2-oxoglutarate aldolase
MNDAPGNGTVAALLELGSATLGESGAATTDRRLRAAWRGARLAAPAFTVRCAPGDNLAVHVGVTTAPQGSALVVDVGAVAGRGYWGEVLTTAAESAGLVGLVIDGCVRDVDALEAHGFPVFSTGIALPGATKKLPGAVGAPVRVGGVAVATGDWVVAVLEAGRTRAAKEDTFFTALRQGTTTVELLDLDASLVTGT